MFKILCGLTAAESWNPVMQIPPFWCIPPIFIDDNDLLINSIVSSIPGPPGPSGPQGPAGAGCDVDCIYTEATKYECQDRDAYIGTTGRITITLPTQPEYGRKITVKAENRLSRGAQKITIKTSDGSLIDGKVSQVLNKPYESITVIYRENWYIIG